MLRFGLPIAILWFAVDQSTKWWILNYVMNPPRVIPVTGFFNLVLGRNTGVIFGLFGEARPSVLVAIAIGVVLVLVVWMSRAENRLTASALGLIAGGAIGNVLDRLRHGGVTDFLEFYIGQWHWPSFNMADVGIVCGAGLLLLESFLSGKQREPSRT